MIRALPLLALVWLMLPAAATAADRRIGVGSFARVRIDGAFRVVITPGPPRVTLSGDARAIENVAVDVNGDTLVVHAGTGAWGERPAGTGSVTVTLSTPMLTRVAAIGGADVQVSSLKADRIDLTVSGSGSIAVAAVEAEQLAATVVGFGGITLAGHASRARLVANGPGGIDAHALATDDLVVAHEGAGPVTAQARITAQVSHNGLGEVTVTGNARCTVRATGGSTVSCGPTP